MKAISIYRARLDLSNPFNGIGQLATQIIQSTTLQICQIVQIFMPAIDSRIVISIYSLLRRYYNRWMIRDWNMQYDLY